MIYPDLWKKIKEVEFDAIALNGTFSEHLAASNGWTPSFAQRAIREYKKFMYLSAVSERSLVPSDVVEQVWRMHLTDTRHYWGTFCKMIGKPIHHVKVGQHVAESTATIAEYEHTRTFYEEEFKQPPRSEFWPVATSPHAINPPMERVNRSRYLILQKPTMRLWRSVGRFAGVATFPLSIVAYAVNQSSGAVTGEITSTGWLMVAGVAVVIATFGCLVWRMESKAKADYQEKIAQEDLNVAPTRFA